MTLYYLLIGLTIEKTNSKNVRFFNDPITTKVNLSGTSRPEVPTESIRKIAHCDARAKYLTTLLMCCQKEKATLVKGPFTNNVFVDEVRLSGPNEANGNLAQWVIGSLLFYLCVFQSSLIYAFA